MNQTQPVQPVEKKKNSFGKRVLEFVMKTMNGMAHGLFCTLIIGTIINTIGTFFVKDSFFNVLLTSLGSGFLFKLTGVGIAVGIGLSLELKGLKLISLASVGGLSTFLANPYGFKTGDPLTVYLVVILVYLAMEFVLRKKTPVDIIIVPLFAIAIGTILTLLLSKPVSFITTLIGKYIGVATGYQPLLMGIIIAVIMGMALTAPISSAAIAATIFTESALAANENVAIAGGAAVIGCCCQMVGFAIQAIRDNKIGSVFAIGVGTSMLEFKNILKKPVIWLPTILASAILGPIGTCVLKTKCMGTSAGMGTSGLVGIIGTYSTMGYSLNTILSIVILELIAPAILVFGFDFLFHKLHLINNDDLAIEGGENHGNKNV
jgi:uncharacterized membrane protein